MSDNTAEIRGGYELVFFLLMNRLKLIVNDETELLKQKRVYQDS